MLTPFRDLPPGLPENPSLTYCFQPEYTAAQQSVTVDKQGVAISKDTLHGTIMRLAAVRVADGSEAEHVPFRVEEEGTLQFALPTDRPSKIGFFLGYLNTTVSPDKRLAVARIGEFPGMPLATYQEPARYHREMNINLGGLKPDELDEAHWAHQTNLFEDLGFHPARCRGFFSRITQKAPDTADFTQQRLVVTPSGTEDLVEGADFRVNSTVFQFLGFAALPAVQRSPAMEIWRQHSDVGRNLYSYGDSLKEPGLSTGFGQGFDTTSEVQRVQPGQLLSAFKVQIVPGS